MAWFSGKVSLGGFPDLAGAVNKLQESVKNIEKNFDSALGFEEKSNNEGSSSEASGLWSSATERKTLFDPVMAFMGHRNEENAVLSSVLSPERTGSLEHPSMVEGAGGEIDSLAPKQITSEDEEQVPKVREADEPELAEVAINMVTNPDKAEFAPDNVDLPGSQTMSTEPPEFAAHDVRLSDSIDNQEKDTLEVAPCKDPELVEAKPESVEAEQVGALVFMPEQVHIVVDAPEDVDKHAATDKEVVGENSPVRAEVSSDSSHGERNESSGSLSIGIEEAGHAHDISLRNALPLNEASEIIPKSVPETDETIEAVEVDPQTNDSETDEGQHVSSATNIPDSLGPKLELEKAKKEMKMMETALQGAARQAQVLNLHLYMVDGSLVVD
ncbi:golgin candidate 5-like [Carica papaya]|uniref:golgin candidate 5-like n=1 Tax=Carica papaya TaxID=3649 RepID=UPI000B8CD8DF|nr:golgin candidate 5-like [Carica papaya]